MNYCKNTVYYFDSSLIDHNGNFVSGKTLTYKIFKSSINTLVDSGIMTEIGITGVYRFSYSFTEVGEYRIEYYTPDKYENGIETILVTETGIDNINIKIERILGLSQENYRIFSPTYVTKAQQSCMTSAIIKIYANASDCENDINAIGEYAVTATFDNNARMTNYKVKKK